MYDANKLRKVPYIITMLRIVLTPIFFYLYLLELRFIVISLFIIISLSDIIDGQLAKKLEVVSTSPLEAYIDAVADFWFVTIAFSAFAIKGVHPTWIPFVLVIMFLFFVFTSNFKHPIYDSIGKYYGIYLIAAIGFTLFFPIMIIYNCILFSFLVYTIILIVYRTHFLLKKRRKMNMGDANDPFAEEI